MFVLAVVVFALAGITVPVLGFVGLFRYKVQHKRPGLVMRAIAEAISGPFKRRVWWYGPIAQFFVCACCRCTSAFLTSFQFESGLVINDGITDVYAGSTVKIYVQLALLSVYIIVIAIVRPFDAAWKNPGIVIVLVLSILSSLSQLFVSWNYLAPVVPLSYAVMALLLLFLCIVLLGLFYRIRGKRWLAMLRARRLLASGTTEDELPGILLQRRQDRTCCLCLAELV